MAILFVDGRSYFRFFKTFNSWVAFPKNMNRIRINFTLILLYE